MKGCIDLPLCKLVADSPFHIQGDVFLTKTFGVLQTEVNDTAQYYCIMNDKINNYAERHPQVTHKTM